MKEQNANAEPMKGHNSAVTPIIFDCTSKYSSFLSFSAKLAMSSSQLQGIEGRSVQFATCVEVEVICWGFGQIVVQYPSPLSTYNP